MELLRRDPMDAALAALDQELRRSGGGSQSLGHFLGHPATTHAKVSKVDGAPSQANVPIHKDTKPSKVFSASS